MLMIGAGIYLSVVAVMSLVCFITYGFDKHRAVRGGRRVPERTLQTMAFIGGWPGAILAQRYFRHKTYKQPFITQFWLLVILHLGIVGAAIYGIAISHVNFPKWTSSEPTVPSDHSDAMIIRTAIKAPQNQ